jgi:hypothetical protein
MIKCDKCGCLCHCEMTCMCECAGCEHGDQQSSNEQANNESGE